MAGHSKWANIKHRKGAQDAKRAKVFAKISKEIIVAASIGGGDPTSNSSLRLVLAKARAASMPKKNIEAAISKATGSGGGSNFKEFTYGGNIAGVSFLVTCLADNANRVSSSVQAYFNKANGSVTGASGVAYIFDRKGVLEFDLGDMNEEEVMMIALDAGAEDFEAEDGKCYVYTEPSVFQEVKDKIEENGITDFTVAEVKYIPNQLHKVESEKAQKILDFIDRIEDDDDVQDVFHNLDPDSLA